MIPKSCSNLARNHSAPAQFRIAQVSGPTEGKEKRLTEWHTIPYTETPTELSRTMRGAAEFSDREKTAKRKRRRGSSGKKRVNRCRSPAMPFAPRASGMRLFLAQEGGADASSGED